jgi:hypothetical protein
VTAGLDDDDLPGFWREADAASLESQALALRLSRLRLAGVVIAALGGALTLRAGGFDLWALLGMVGFAIALVAELVLLVQEPERDWYAGRALAESAKTLAWRYAVGASPFLPTLSPEDARSLMRDRLVEVASQDQGSVTIRPVHPDVTPAMERLRSAPYVPP